MGNFDDKFYEEMYTREYNRKDRKYNEIIQEFENLSLEEKVNKLIKIYATEIAYK